jgi:hypothetical protein
MWMSPTEKSRMLPTRMRIKPSNNGDLTSKRLGHGCFTSQIKPAKKKHEFPHPMGMVPDFSPAKKIEDFSQKFCDFTDDLDVILIHQHP